MRTYRLNIEAIDLSDVQVTDGAADFAGFTTIKAKRGMTEPLFVPAGNASYIIEQFGPPRASSPEVQEAIDFNQNNPIFISAPPGTENNGWHNLHGTLFISKDGLYRGRIAPAATESTVKSRTVFFEVEQASGPGNTAFILESTESNPSKYLEYFKLTTKESPAKMDQGSLFKAFLEWGEDQETLYAMASENWTDRGTVTLPTDANTSDDTSVAYLLQQLESQHASWFTDNPGYFRILRHYNPDTEQTGDFVGVAYLLEGTDDRLEMHVRVYTAVQEGDPENDAPEYPYGADPTEDLMHGSHDFFNSFLEANSKERASLEWEAQIEAEAMIFQKFPTETRTDIRITRAPRTTASDNYVRVTVTDRPARNIEIAPREYDVSLDRDQEDGFGTSQFIEDVIQRDRVVEVLLLGDEEDDPVMIEEIAPFQDDEIPPEGYLFSLTGERAIDHMTETSDIASSLEAGWEAARDAEYDNVVIFFDSWGYEELNPTMVDIRTTHQFSRVVQPALKGFTQADVEDIPDARSNYANHHGLVYPINEILTRDPRSGTRWWRFPVGAYCDMLVRIMRQKNGAWAPMFQNDAGNLGGQLDASFEKIRITRIPVELQRDIDETGFNTLIYDSDMGLVMVNQRTAQNPDTLNDASWLSHDMAFDLFKRLVYRNIMIPQLGKPINSQYIGTRTRQLQNLATRFGNAFNAVRVEVDSLNTAATRAQRRFQMATSVQVTPFSEFVDFFFYNVGQEASVDDPFED